MSSWENLAHSLFNIASLFVFFFFFSKSHGAKAVEEHSKRLRVENGFLNCAKVEAGRENVIWSSSLKVPNQVKKKKSLKVFLHQSYLVWLNLTWVRFLFAAVGLCECECSYRSRVCTIIRTKRANQDLGQEVGLGLPTTQPRCPSFVRYDAGSELTAQRMVCFRKKPAPQPEPDLDDCHWLKKKKNHPHCIFKFFVCVCGWKETQVSLYDLLEKSLSYQNAWISFIFLKVFFFFLTHFLH